MNNLTILQNITPLQTAKQNPCPLIRRPFHQTRRETPFTPPRSWRIHSGAKGFTGSPKGKENIPTKSDRRRNSNDDDDDKIPDVVLERIAFRILFSVGVPLLSGFALLQIMSVLKERELWDVPIWVPFLTTFVTFGTSALGIAYGSLSSSLTAENEGSFLGFEQFEKNWNEMWKEEDETSDG